MRWMASAVVTAAMATACGANEPGGEYRDMRERIETLDRELGRELHGLENAGEPGDRAGRMRPPVPSRPPMPNDGPGGSRGPERTPPPGSPEGRPTGGDRMGPPPGRPDGAPGHGGTGAGGGLPGHEDMEFQLRMAEREILHKIENLKWELETIRLKREHLRRRAEEGRQVQRPGQPGEKRPAAGEPRGADMQDGLRQRMERLETELRRARDAGDRERVRELEKTMQNLRRLAEEGRPAAEPRRDGVREPGSDLDRRRADLERVTRELHEKLRLAEESGDREGARQVREKLELLMRELTGEHRENVQRKGADALERIERRMGELKTEMQRARDGRDRGRLQVLEEEMEKLQRMAGEVRRKLNPPGEREGDPRKKEKKPRMI